MSSSVLLVVVPPFNTISRTVNDPGDPAVTVIGPAVVALFEVIVAGVGEVLFMIDHANVELSVLIILAEYCKPV